MKAADIWYVRLPDGKVVRARNTKALRYHIRHGRVPVEARVRRTSADEWTSLDWASEFADLIPKAKANGPGSARHRAAAAAKPAKVRQRPNLPAVQTLGVRPFVGELLSALDRSLTRFKLTAAAATGIFIGVAVIMAAWALAWGNDPWGIAVAASIGFGAMVAFNLASALITQATFVEFSRLRPARSDEISAGLFSRTCRLAAAQIVVAGVLGAAIYYARLLPGWLTAGADEGQILSEWQAAPVLVLQLLFETVCWPLLALTFLLGPILVIEECSVLRGLANWCGLLRRHLGRLLTYEALTLAVGILVAVPLVLPVLLTAWAADGAATSQSFTLVRESTLGILGGVALAPFLAYMVVANTFIYLKLKYEFLLSPQ